ncbi:hypothetical protein NCAS_0C01170 [Naumovozyma castellii]|uniref:Phosphatidylinositol N-acetylglucosaminyltransferase GPI3 subunit n=1 Tax=Naumovozyma castellii TaxID=27288 RepID=G0VC98_NAUCA|nr:hypothetical protein NCAS_0C01170 [Naumovozyma castellii CBS 4309]CCC69107.1 hypothetical protein NCAS_0C01170 [Naumovozyma castellii CBS 4309]
MVCDFFYPQLGGVEFHIYHLAQNLIRLGHSVVVITHAYKDRVGVRYLTNGLKVYHVPFLIMYRETAFPTVFSAFPAIRNILIREEIQIIHSHGGVSTFAHEAVLHGNTMGIRTVFTDHSLYGFHSTGAVLANKVAEFTLTNIDRVICVSSTCKENIVVRADISPSRISVIPNAVVSEDFTPRSVEKTINGKKKFTIVIIGRLFPNKGSSLLTLIIPSICATHEDVNFIVAGDGPNFVDFQQMIETHRLQERVELLGAVPHEKVRDVLCRGDIYLHASLTEAFGTVLIEAASCGLLIVTTTVGGIPEVLPEDMTVYAHETSVSSLIDATNEGIRIMRTGSIDAMTFHKRVGKMYDWLAVAQRTVAVYDDVYYNYNPYDKKWSTMVARFYRRNGSWARLLYVLCAIVDYYLYFILEFLYPRKNIDIAPKWPKRSEVNWEST